MALTVNNVTTASSTTLSPTLAVGSVTAAVGEWLVVFAAADNSGTLGGASILADMSDTAGNTYVNRVLTYTDPGAADEGSTIAIWTAPVTSAITGGTITTNFNPDTPAKVVVVQRVTPLTGHTVGFSAVGSAFLGRNSTVSRTTPSIVDGYTLFCAVAVETSNAVQGDTDTTNGSWSTVYTAVANTGVANGSQSIGTQYKTVTATATQTWNPSWVSIADYVGNHIVLYDVDNPDATVDVTGVSATGAVGTSTVQIGGTGSPLGAAATVGVGTISVTASGIVSATGVLGTTAVGTAGVGIGVNVRPTGVYAIAATGFVVVPTGSTTQLLGVGAVASAGYGFVWSAVDDIQLPDWQNTPTPHTPNWTPVVDAQTPNWN